ncbi:histidinol-phosphate transaminase [Chitinivibrio alkaliphilus]|nr:histidinol-phosphate transaminase [Chitinivibrio alkaliphilus]
MKNMFWSDTIQGLEPYQAGEQPQDKAYVKLNTNENPYGPSPRAQEVLRQIPFSDLRLYPDPESLKLRQSIATYYGRSVEEVFVGNGSDEILAFVYMAFFQGKRPIRIPSITYSFYPVYCNMFNVDAVLEPLEDDFTLNLDSYSTDNGGIIFPNPNAPTGRAVPLEEIRQLLQRNTDSVVVVDEAYADFGAESAVDLVEEFPNLLVVQTFSKSRSLAGLRVGFAIGNADLIAGLSTVKDSFNSYPVDRISLEVCAAAMDDHDYFVECCEKIKATRERVSQQLSSWGFSVLPSQANFIFVKPPAPITAEKMYLQLKEKGVLVRYFHNKPGIKEFCRISIGSDAEMDIFMEKMSSILSSVGVV